MTATQLVSMLCSREITAAELLESYLTRLYADGYACLNTFQYLNASQVWSLS